MTFHGVRVRERDAFDDRVPTEPIAVGRCQARLPGDRDTRGPGATNRRMPSAHRVTVLIAVAVAIAAITGALGHRTWESWSPSAAPGAGARSASAPSPATEDRQAGGVRPPQPPPRADDRHGDRRSARGEAAGAVPDGVTVFDDEIPAVANLDPGLLRALRRAAADAADDGVEFAVNSGWRSPEYQERLLREAIAEYGSEAEAARWVATADTSPHVSGDAVDIGPADARAWLSDHGAEYGLCQIYRNEPWHYELRPDASDDGCPPLYADPTQDPRMQR